MDWQVSLTASAEDDVRQALQFIAEHSPPAALRFADALYETFASLRRLPRRGSPMSPRLGLRHISFRYLLIYYRIDEARRRVLIIRVWDGRQDPAKFRVR